MKFIKEILAFAAVGCAVMVLVLWISSCEMKYTWDQGSGSKFEVGMTAAQGLQVTTSILDRMELPWEKKNVSP